MPSAPTTPRMSRNENNTSTRTLPRNSKILWQEPRSRPQSYAEPGEGMKTIELEAASKSHGYLFIIEMNIFKFKINLEF